MTVNSDIEATTGSQDANAAPSGHGGSVTLASTGGSVTVNSRIEVSSNDPTPGQTPPPPIRRSNSGGTILLQSDLTTGQGITVASNAQNRVSQITDPANHVWSFGYDGNGNLTSITRPDSKQIVLGYATNNTLTQITDPNGNATTIGYSGLKVATITRPGTNTWTFTYNTSSTQVKDPNAHTTTYGYDSSGRITSVTDAESHTTNVSWTSDNHVASVQKPSGATTTYAYDSKNNPTQVTLPGGAHASWQYADSNHPYEPTSFTDAQGNMSSYQYNASGLLSQVTDALGHVTTYSYVASGAALGALASMTDPNGHVTSYGYNSQGLRSSVAYPSPLGAHSFTYNTEDQLASEVDGKNQTTNYSYDADGRLTSVSYAGGSSVSYTYDANGNRTGMTDGTGTTTYTYNALNQLTKVSTPTSGGATYTWDAVGNLLSSSAGSGATYTYTADNQVQTVRACPPSTCTTNTLTYDQDGNLTGNGNDTMTYNSAGQLTKIAGAATSFTYSYTNPANNQSTALRYSVTDGSGNTTSNTYDALNRLTQAVQKNSSGGQIASYAYSYDPAGNVTSKTVNGTQTSMSYNAANELTQAGSTTYSYDANGSETGSSAGLSMGYNSQNQMTSITVPGQTAQTLTYTDRGESNLVSISGNSLVSDLTGVVGWDVQFMPTYWARTPAGQLLQRFASNGMGGFSSAAYETDGNGSVSASGGQFTYDPYGNLLSGAGFSGPSFRFDGAMWYDPIGLDKMGERYYDPSVGRWTQMDRMTGNLRDPQSLNRYAFVEGDPINFVDPMGTCNGFDLAAAAGGFVFGVLSGAGAVATAPETGGLGLWGYVGIAGGVFGIASSYYSASQCF